MGVLKRKNLSLIKLKKAMWSLDELIIPIDTLESFREAMPTSSEVDRVKNYTGSDSDLNKASQFFWAMKDIPRPLQRVRLWLFIRKVNIS